MIKGNQVIIFIFLIALIGCTKSDNSFQEKEWVFLSASPLSKDSESTGIIALIYFNSLSEGTSFKFRKNNIYEIRNRGKIYKEGKYLFNSETSTIDMSDSNEKNVFNIINFEEDTLRIVSQPDSMELILVKKKE